MPHEKNLKRRIQINIRFTLEEKNKLQQLAINSGLKLSRYLRKIALEKDPVFMPEQDRKMLQELLRAAFEIKRALNKYHEARTPDLNEYYQTIREFNERIKKMK
ncbi:MAG: hypothetical protein RL308_2610 [Bacteroidota bacterium]|jgi:DNA-binding protein YbaB